MHDNQRNDAIQHACCKDPAQRNVDVVVWSVTRIAACGNDDGDKRKARPQIARYTSSDNYEENQSADTRIEQCQIRIKTHKEWRNNRSACHRDPMLQT